MNSLTSFVKLSNNESVLQEWEVLHDKGGFRAADIVSLLILCIVFVGIQVISGEFISVAFRVPIVRDVLSLLGPLIRLIFFTPWVAILIASALMVIIVVSRPVISGQIALSNWRLLYYERGEGKLSRFHHFVASVNLEDVVGVHSEYQEALWGVKNLSITVHTKHKNGIALRIGDNGGLLGKLPLVGAWFKRNTMGPDAAAFMPMAFRLIQENKGRTADSSVSY